MKTPKPRKLSSGAWFIQLRLGGVSVPVTAPTAKECTRQAALIKAEHLSGKISLAKPKSDMTIRQGIDKYISGKQNKLSPSTIRGYRHIQRMYFKAYMDTPMCSIKDWQAVYDSERDRLSPKTLKNSFCLIKSVYSYCMDGNPMPKVEIVPVVPHVHPFLDADQIPVFMNAIRGKSCELGALLALSSMRSSEIFDLTWDDIDLHKKMIHVDGSTVRTESGQYVHKDANKTSASKRYIPIYIPRLFDILCAKEDKTGKVINYAMPSGLYKAINRICKTNGLPEVGLHGLRHSFASLAVHLGVPEETTMTVGGWSDFQTMRKIYTHISNKDMRSHMDAYADFFKRA